MQSGEWILAKVAQLLELWNPHPHHGKTSIPSVIAPPRDTPGDAFADAIKRWSRFDELQTDINAFPEKFTPFRHSELSAVIEFYFAPSSSPWLGKQLNHILQSKFGGKLQPVKYFPSFIHGKKREECQISAGRWQKAHAENGADLMLIEFCWAATLFLFMGNCYHRLESPKVHRIHLEVQNEHCLAW